VVTHSGLVVSRPGPYVSVLVVVLSRLSLVGRGAAQAPERPQIHQPWATPRLPEVRTCHLSSLRLSLCWKPRTVGQLLESDMVDGGHISRFSRSSVSSDLRSANLACPRFFALNCSAFCYAQATSSAVRPTTRTNSLMRPMHRTKRALLVGDADANFTGDARRFSLFLLFLLFHRC